MLNFKRQPAAHVAPEFISSEWIAHNAAMREKAPLLGHGAKPVIGRAYCPRPVIQSAVYVSAPVSRTGKFRDVAMVATAVAVFALFAWLGSFAGLN